MEQLEQPGIGSEGAQWGVETEGCAADRVELRLEAIAGEERCEQACRDARQGLGTSKVRDVEARQRGRYEQPAVRRQARGQGSAQRGGGDAAASRNVMHQHNSAR